MPRSRQPRQSRQVISPEEWELQRDTILKIYVHNTLIDTVQIMEKKHKFKASKRKYKMQFREWKVCKHLSATDMTAVVVIDATRARLYGKETEFFIDGHPLGAERIENFKKRVTFNEEILEFPSVTTPRNITYQTPLAEDNPDIEDGDETQNLDIESEVESTSFTAASQLMSQADIDTLNALFSDEQHEISKSNSGMFSRDSLTEHFEHGPYDMLDENEFESAASATGESSQHERAPHACLFEKLDVLEDMLPGVGHDEGEIVTIYEDCDECMNITQPLLGETPPTGLVKRGRYYQREKRQAGRYMPKYDQKYPGYRLEGANNRNRSSGNDEDKESDFNTDRSSCKYGKTYSVSEITGISDSWIMKP